MEQPPRRHPKICDYAYVQGGEAILIDANNRNLPRSSPTIGGW